MTAVTGLGLVTPAGIGTSTNWARILSGKPAAAPAKGLAGMPVEFACQVPGFDGEELLGARQARRMDRYVQFAVAATREAIGDANLDPRGWDGSRVGVVMGTGAGGTGTMETQHHQLTDNGARRVSPLALPMGLPNMAAAQLAIELGATGPNLAVCTACASGATAIGVARDLLRSGAADVVLAGGAEAAVTPFFAAAFARMKALSNRHDDPAAASRPFDTGRDGFVMAEGAGVLVLESEEHARRRDAPIRARLAGYGASADAFHVTAPHPDGEGARRAMRAALADAGLGGADIDHVNAHGTSTPQGDLAEAKIIERVIGRRAAVSSAKGVIGHALGAAGAIEAAYTVLSVEHGLVPPTANLDRLDPGIDLDIVSGAPRRRRVDAAMSNSFGFGGHNAVLVFAAA
ncbi:3-oxoacyl-[acyl-carrier-protein] synthase II [Nonomuraea solani]|uniref:3-oxoacyl-[acyl-carrier-protein] synthase 2 n=1 Tax=Nonomuraea solani TaxID=1144553 RepID=A0A1H6EDZ0_9ACTN|nr:beta-ketoacyl-ACP synthase II [Nonomuraea solani]SEG95491.1 3-oxoacyl-[acyl-carrier-protein] synthase II [Nonomuraea solani]